MVYLSCYNPNLMKCSVDIVTGDLKYTFEGKAKLTDPKNYGTVDDLATKGYYYILIPCGKCLGCRIDYSREWANRMVFELVDNDFKAIFVTLTYNNEHLKFSDFGDATLNVRDCQLFMKRLRKHFSDKKIRFYLCGEYGSTTYRPHYHAILFGLSLQDFSDLRCFGFNELKDPYFTSKTFENIWQNGFVMMSDVNYRTCAYVARYVTKKQGKQEYVDSGIVPEFNLSSRNPGIGLLHSSDYVLSGMSQFNVACSDGSRTLSLPKTMIRNVARNAEKNLDFDTFDFCRNLSYNRSKDAHERLISNLLACNKAFDEFLSTKEKNFKNKLSLLPDRSVE